MMTYLEEFRTQLNARNLPKVIQLWEEYCQGDNPEEKEICEILKLIKESDFAKHFGQYVETILLLIEQIPNEDDRFAPLQYVIDIETTNSPDLFNRTMHYLKKLYSHSPLFNEKLRLVGLRGGDLFQGAISNFLLLNHLEKGNFVLHTAGWGVGQIIDVSFLREQVAIEFEYLQGGKKEIAFKNGFKTLLPIPKTHFLARRFAEPDLLEEEAKENPQEVIKSLLSDLGPKTASEIKEEMIDIVIQEKEYSKWWQQARAKLKKDQLIESPEHTKEPFRLLAGHASWEERIEKAFQQKNSAESVLQAAHSLIRDFPEVLKNEQASFRIIARVQDLLIKEDLSPAQRLQVLLFLENPLGVVIQEDALKRTIVKLEKIDHVLSSIEIVTLKKRLLSAIREWRPDWADIFLELIFTIEPNQLRDLLLKELSTPQLAPKIEERLASLAEHPKKHPEALLWYFQKILSEEAPYFNDRDSRYKFFEALLVLFASLSSDPEMRDFSKKIYSLLTKGRFQIVRDFLKNSTQTFAQEFLLLCSKCHAFSDHDKKILRSLVEVVHPDLVKESRSDIQHLHVIWTTEEGYKKVYERTKHIGTKELFEVSREIEAARALGDLRENAEFKAACERRARLQGELKMLSEQIRHARILTKDDIASDAIGVGNIAELLGPKGEKITYTILGPWEADPDKNILSFQSKFAQAMEGKKVGEKFAFKGEEYKILHIKSAL
jgi:transcription elongation factor GreA-like protein/transcription elongation GreA/GreB family factor